MNAMPQQRILTRDMLNSDWPVNRVDQVVEMIGMGITTQAIVPALNADGFRINGMPVTERDIFKLCAELRKDDCL